MLLISYLLLGGWALWFGLYAAPEQEPAAFVHLKPTIMYWVLSLILIVAPLLGSDYPIKVVLGTYFVFSSREWRWMNLGFAVLFTALGTANLLAAFTASESDWVGFKFSCMVNVMFIFLARLSFIWVETAGRIIVYLHQRAKAFFL